MPKTATKDFRDGLKKRAGGKCECRGRNCSHHSPGKRCGAMLRAPGWDAHRIKAKGPYTLSGTKAMCARCHRNTTSYGRG